MIKSLASLLCFSFLCQEHCNSSLGAGLTMDWDCWSRRSHLLGAGLEIHGSRVDATDRQWVMGLEKNAGKDEGCKDTHDSRKATRWEPSKVFRLLVAQKKIQLSIVFWGQNGGETHTKPQVQWFGSKIPRPTGQHIKNRIELHERALVQRTTSSKDTV